jgi:hypothetical protein
MERFRLAGKGLQKNQLIKRFKNKFLRQAGNVEKGICLAGFSFHGSLSGILLIDIDDHLNQQIICAYLSSACVRHPAICAVG